MTMYWSSDPATPILVSALCLLIGLLWTCGHCQTSRNLPPGSFGWPIIGETWAFLVNGTNYMDTRLQKYGPVFKTSILGSHTVVVSGAANVRPVLLGEGRSVLISQPKSAKSLFGQGALCTSVGDKHRALHRAIMQTFRPDTLATVTPVIHEIVRDFIGRWRLRGLVASGVEECRVLSFTISTRVLLGLEFTDVEVMHVMQLFDVYNKSFFSFPVNFPGFQYRKGLQARAEMMEILSGKLPDLKPSSESDARICLLLELIKLCTSSADLGSQKAHEDESRDCDAGVGLQITDQFKSLAVELVFGSHETIASGFCALAIRLAEHPDVYARVHQELDELGVAGENVDSLTYKDVTSCTYVNDVMKEMLRLMPPIAGAFRRTLEPCNILGYEIPAGWTILYSITTTHKMSSKLSRDTIMRFRPDRWSKEEHTKRNPNGEDKERSLRRAERPGNEPAAHEDPCSSDCKKGDSQNKEEQNPKGQAPRVQTSADETLRNTTKTRQQERERVPTSTKGSDRFEYIPFGGGQRICVGREFAKLVLRLFIMEMVRGGEWTLVNGFPEMVTAPIPFPKDGMPIRFHTR